MIHENELLRIFSGNIIGFFPYCHATLILCHLNYTSCLFYSKSNVQYSYMTICISSVLVWGKIIDVTSYVCLSARRRKQCLTSCLNRHLEAHANPFACSLHVKQFKLIVFSKMSNECSKWSQGSYCYWNHAGKSAHYSF